MALSHPPPRIAIGIDAGKLTGFAAWDRRDREFAELKTLTFWTVHDHVIANYSPLDSLIVIEQPSLNAPTFGHNVTDHRIREKVSQDVGRNKEQATLLIERFTSLGYEVRAVKPNRRKWTAEEFARMTGVKTRTSQHTRDAARLVLGF